jgi:hypothetical protein
LLCFTQADKLFLLNFETLKKLKLRLYLFGYQVFEAIINA